MNPSKKGVKNIQTAGYNGARTVFQFLVVINCANL